MRFPRFEGGDDSITTIYKNHTRIPAMATNTLKRYSPRKRAVKKPITAAKGIKYPTPDFMSLFITKLRFYLRITPKIDLF